MRCSNLQKTVPPVPPSFCGSMKNRVPPAPRGSMHGNQKQGTPYKGTAQAPQAQHGAKIGYPHHRRKGTAQAQGTAPYRHKSGTPSRIHIITPVRPVRGYPLPLP